MTAPETASTPTSTSSLFEPAQVGAWKLPSRVVMAPLTRNRAPRQVPTALMAQYYAQRADPRDGAALIVTEATPVCPEGHGYADTPGIHNAEQVAAWRRVTDAVHARGGLIVVQLWHVGRVSHVLLQPNQQAPVAPSALRANTKTYLIDAEGRGSFEPVSTPRALALEEIPGVVESFRRGSALAMEAGFDGVEVHGANGYLIDQFLRSGSNHRDDGYGGTIENRTRLLEEVMTVVSAEVGGERTGLRLSPVTPANDASDPQPQALFEHAVRQLAPLGLAYLHLIEGATGGARDHQQGEAPFDYAAMRAAWRSAGGRGAWMVNNGYTRELAEASLAQGADLVAFGRDFLANPDLTRRMRERAPLNAGDRKTFYGGGAEGYTDYPALNP